MAGYISTRDFSRSLRIVESIDVGLVGVNSPLPTGVSGPMGGLKQSGLGCEGGREGLHEFTATRFVTFGIEEGEKV